VWKLVVLLDVGGYVPYLFPKLEVNVVGLEESGGKKGPGTVRAGGRSIRSSGAAPAQGQSHEIKKGARNDSGGHSYFFDWSLMAEYTVK
jgi:hypothetical protein